MSMWSSPATMANLQFVADPQVPYPFHENGRVSSKPDRRSEFL
jgi:hypothetical protein